jgi:5-methylcytosine-specific restriction enzyme subunit McrC
MRRLELIEFKTQASVTLSVAERDALRRLHPGIRVDPAIGSEGRYDLTPDQRIGLVCLPTLVIEVRPKIPMSSVLFLVSYACDAVSWFEHHSEYALDLDLVEILAIMLARMVQQATRRGLLNGYQCEDESLQAPRGRILFDEQIRRHLGVSPPIQVRHDLFTPDVIENRLLLAALAAMGQIPLRSQGTNRELLRAQRLFGAVSRVHFPAPAVPEVVFTRLNCHYRPAISLATLLLRSGSLDLGTGIARGSAFLIDMNKVFERFVRGALRADLETEAAAFPETPPRTYLDKAGLVPLKPDLCLVKDRRIVWVGDAKYKRLPVGAYQNADLYQLLAYTVALDLPGGMLIYAADEGVKTAEHVVVKNGKRLRVVALDLSAPRSKLILQIKTIALEIRLSARSFGADRARVSAVGAA